MYYFILKMTKKASYIQLSLILIFPEVIFEASFPTQQKYTFNTLIMPAGNKKLHLLKQTCSWALNVQLQIYYLSKCMTFLLPPGIKGLRVASKNSCFSAIFKPFYFSLVLRLAI